MLLSLVKLVCSYLIRFPVDTITLNTHLKSYFDIRVPEDFLHATIGVDNSPTYYFCSSNETIIIYF